ncbi:MAG TPA: hypothetical protein DCQ98_09915 [Planctomycetaceae bacterium]|nr:hypothetical protein [Planctomycetaceae bacterium]
MAKVKVQADQCLCCERKRIARGLCSACYATALRVIRSGERTEQELIDRGLILPSKKIGRPRTNAFLLKVEGAKACETNRRGERAAERAGTESNGSKSRTRKTSRRKSAKATASTARSS